MSEERVTDTVEPTRYEPVAPTPGTIRLRVERLTGTGIWDTLEQLEDQLLIDASRAGFVTNGPDWLVAQAAKRALHALERRLRAMGEMIPWR